MLSQGCLGLLASRIAVLPTLWVAADSPKQFTAQQRRWWAFQKITKPAVPQPQNRRG